MYICQSQSPNSPFLFFLNFIYLFIYFWLCCVFISVRGLSLVAASGGHSSLRCTGLSLSWPLLLQSTGSRHTGSVAVAHGPSCSAACGIFPDQGLNLCPLHWQADSQPLCHQGSPLLCILDINYCIQTGGFMVASLMRTHLTEGVVVTMGIRGLSVTGIQNFTKPVFTSIFGIYSSFS